MKRPILRAFVAITRVDEENRIVEGYAAVNESVAGDKYKLTRSALQSATPDYTTWGAVREMHQPSAVGTCNDNGQTEGLGVEWDDKGAFLRCKIVDDVAWEKVKQGVYKGFSVGVRCDKIERGNEVTACTWVETSLVDRPADPDAKIMAFRCDEAEDDEPTVDRIEAHIAEMEERGCFADMAKDREKQRLRYAAMDWLNECLVWPWPRPADPETHARECISEFEIYWLSRNLHVFDENNDRSDVPDLFRALTSEDVPKRESLEGKAKKKKCDNDDEPEEDEDKKRLARFGEVEAENRTLTERAEKAEADLNKERELARALQVQIDELKAKPRDTRPPTKFTGVARTFQGDEEGASAEDLKRELKEIIDRAPTYTPQEQDERVKRVSEIKRILKTEHGIEVA